MHGLSGMLPQGFRNRRYSGNGEVMTDYEKLEWIWCAIDEIILNYPDIETIYPLETAQDLVHQLREPYLVE